MSIADWGPITSGAVPARLHSRRVSQVQPLHRLSVVRRHQNMSQRNIARHLGIDMATVRHQEQETTDLLLSTLYAWQKVLDVPVSELLVESDGSLSPPVLARAQMVKLMKTAVAILEKAEGASVHRLVEMLIAQLLEIMPELKDVGPWHSLGRHRTADTHGRAAEHIVPDQFLRRQ